MIDSNNLPSSFIFMKVGVHASETLEDIIDRKRKEFDDVGMIFWGYGGGTCHPIKQVQPFARNCLELGQQIYLMMEEIESNHKDKGLFAEEYSEDGIEWKPIPQGINVRSSRYALVLDELKPGDLDIDLSQSSVAIGDCRGRDGSDYIKGRVDKGCLALKDNYSLDNIQETGSKKIKLISEIKNPFAVLLR